MSLRRTRYKTQYELHREPRDADRLDDKERIAIIRLHVNGRRRRFGSKTAQIRIRRIVTAATIDERRAARVIGVSFGRRRREKRHSPGVAAARRHVNADGSVEIRQRFHAEVDDGDEDADDGNDGKNASRQRTVRLLAEQPQPSLPVHFRQQHLLLDKEAFFLSIRADRLLVELVEFDFFEENVFRNFDRSAKSTSALIVVEYRLQVYYSQQKCECTET